MLCPFCKTSQHTKVIDSRTVKAGRVVRRRRACFKCEERFTTYEEIEISRLSIIKRDGTHERYSRKKIEDGLRRALQKRPVSEERLQKLLVAIESDIQPTRKQTMKSRLIGKIVMNHLRDIDDVAFIRFASVYKAVGSVDGFRKVIQEIMREEEG